MSVVKVSVIGFGGTGATLLSRLGKTPGVPQYLMDTSDSKFSVVDQNTVKTMLIGSTNAEGAGKDRTKHASMIDVHLRSMFADATRDLSGNTIPGMDTDLVICMYSAAGGSGSVTGPIYARMLRDAGKKTIECISTTDIAMVNSANVLGTLKTLSNYATTQAVPVMVVPVNGMDFRTADEELLEQVRLIINQMTTEIIGLDTMDRLNAIGPKQPGMFLTIAAAEDESRSNPPNMKHRPLTAWTVDAGTSPVRIPVHSALLFKNKDDFVWPVNARWCAIGEQSDRASVLLLMNGNEYVTGMIAEIAKDLDAKKAVVQSASAPTASWATTSGNIVAEDF